MATVSRMLENERTASCFVTDCLLKWIRYATALFMSAAALTAQAIEEPAYTVESMGNRADEIRSYASRVMAVTTMQGDEDDGFRVLAGYIFCGNAEEEKIAMTAPVQQSMEGEQEMAFMMPACA